MSIWSFVKNIVIKFLAEFGICCELVVLKGVTIEDITTGTGYLRKKGWVMRMWFKEKTGGNTALKALQIYAKKLDKKYGSKAFQHFRDADMTILLNN